MSYEFHPEALAEFERAARYYAESQPGLEQRFIASVEAAIQRLIEHPSSYAILEQDVRRCLTRVFPYAVLYTVEADFVLIVAVMHCRREPGYWRHRVT
jgi:plasmid stabilization system protein ParE